MSSSPCRQTLRAKRKASYSPYGQAEKKAYPHLLVTTGLHDSQVQYWDPAKWLARLRARKADKNLVLMRTNMDAGHGGASARYQYYEEVARIYAFLHDRAGLVRATPPSPGR